jgi:hypothetical protein
VAEDHGLTGAPVFVINLRPVFRSKGAHNCLLISLEVDLYACQ